MSRKKKDNEVVDELPALWDQIVVGAGPAGLIAAHQARERDPNARVLCLEAGDRTGGRSGSGLHLLPAPLALNPYLRTGPVLAPAKVRWERQWVSPSDVDWEDKDWSAILPQWELYFDKEMVPSLGTVMPFDGATLRFHSPVNRLTRSQDTSMDGWRVEAPGLPPLFAPRVTWAAGLTAFQNAVGKQESVEFLTANPFLNPAAMDHRAGVSLSLHFTKRPNFEASFPVNSVFGLPVRHGGKLSLMIGAAFPLEGDAWTLQTLTHVHRELLLEPNEMMSFQKSLRRAAKSLLDGEGEAFTERWVVSDRVGGHAFGSSWLFGPGQEGSLEFAGDECASSCSKAVQDTSGVLATPASSSL